MQGVTQAISASQCCGPSFPISPIPAMPLAQGVCRGLHLEMKDASVAILKTLAVGNHSVQNSLIESEGGNGSQEPTIPWDRKDPYQACSSDLPRGGRFCVCGMLGTPWDSWVGYPSSSLRLQKRPRNLGEPAPMLIAKACLGLQEGGVGAVPNGTAMGTTMGKTPRTPPLGAYPVLPGRCLFWWLHPR